MKKIAALFIVTLSLIFLNTNCTKNSPEPLAKISIEDLSQEEGNGGINNFNIKVKLDKPASSSLSVSYALQAGTAKVDEDYKNPSSNSISFAQGESEKTISIQIVADLIKEGDDEFLVVLSNPVNAEFADNVATCVIKNDDTKVPIPAKGYTTPNQYTGYQLVWSDEFDAAQLNTNDWGFDLGNGCPNLCGWGNNELESYNNTNVFLLDGSLIIEAKKEGTNAYTSSKIKTKDKKTFKYGRIDIRAKTPTGKGIWPALWMLPQAEVYGGWPNSGEIDIMELVGNEPNKVYSTVHFGPGPPSTYISKSLILTDASEFQVYSLIWTEDKMQFFVNDVIISEINKTDLGGKTYPFNEQFFFIFNLAVGGNWPGNPDATTYFPQWLIVDYVRVFQVKP